MRKFIWAFFFGTLLFATTVFGQDFVTISGRVTDSLTGEPVGGAIVTASPDGVSALTDPGGRFRITRLAPGTLSLQVTSTFHQASQSEPLLCREGDQREVEFRLVPLVLTGAPQEVWASHSRGAGIRGFDRAQLAAGQSGDVGGFLREQGVYTQSDGRAEYATLRGALPEGVLVLLDGQPLNPDGGAVDLAQFPTATLERIDIYTTSAAARFGPNAHGGAINLISRQLSTLTTAEADFRVSHGSYSDHRYGLHWSGGLPAGIALAAGLDYAESENDYEYTHPYLGDLPRANNFARSSSGRLTFRHRDVRPLSFSIYYYGRHLGIPGAVLQESPTAGAQRSGQIYSLDCATSSLNLRAALRQLSQAFHSDEPYASYDTRYLQVARELEAQWRRQLHNTVLLEFGGRVLAETFFVDNLLRQEPLLPTVSRATQSLYGSAALSRPVGRMMTSLDARYRIDRLDDKTFTSPYAGVTIDWQAAFTLGLEASYGESYRYPPLDALFWQESVFSLGNAALRPESAISREWGAHFEIGAPLTVEARTIWFEREVVDQITWRPRFDGKYQPVNIGRVESRGNESSVSVAGPENRLRLRYSRTTQTALNKTTGDGYYDLWAPFLPDRLDRLDLQMRVWRLQLSYAYSLTGKRYLREANTKWLPSYVLHDLTIELALELFKAKQTLRLELLNLADKQYELLERLPMPPSRVRLSFTVEI
ncbi:MAG: TonB-dependent receptor [bacterium]